MTPTLPAPTVREIELHQRLNRCHEAALEAAAMLLLLGTESARAHEHGESWEDESFAGFIASGLTLVALKQAQQLHEAHTAETSDPTDQ